MQEQQSLFGALFIHYSEFQAVAAVISEKRQIILIKLVDSSSVSKRKVHEKKPKDWPPPPSLVDKCIRCSVNQVHINRQRSCVFQRVIKSA